MGKIKQSKCRERLEVLCPVDAIVINGNCTLMTASALVQTILLLLNSSDNMKKWHKKPPNVFFPVTNNGRMEGLDIKLSKYGLPSVYFRLSFYFAEKDGYPREAKLFDMELYLMIRSCAHLGLNDFFHCQRRQRLNKNAIWS